jgi:hypothetical protein
LTAPFITNGQGTIMSTASQPSAPPAAAPREIKIVSHAPLFYWWPVWAIGFLMALLTYLDGDRLAIVPAGTKAVTDQEIPGEGRCDVLIVPAGGHLPADRATGTVTDPTVHVARRAGYGVIFTLVLLLVIFITNVPLRGMWSVVALVTLLLLSIIFALAGWWEDILEFLAHSRIYINAFGYLAIAVPLFLVWLATFVLFDRQAYMVFTPGQLRVHQNIGGGEMAYDTTGMVVEKRRSDLFRHWVLGVGSGDLIVDTSGSKAHHFEMPNVLFVGAKVQLIQQMLQQREVVRGS